MTLRQVSYFVAVAEAGDIGAALIERTSRGARLTTVGGEVLPEVRAS